MIYRAIIVAILALEMGIGISPGMRAQTQSNAAQSASTQTNPPGIATPPIQILVSGCLKRGHDGGYYISDRSGITWTLASAKVDLAAHVMHAVTVTGKPAGLSQPPPQSNQAGGTAANGSGSQHELQVLTLKELSNSCTR